MFFYCCHSHCGKQANIFVHFQPIGHDEYNARVMQEIREKRNLKAAVPVPLDNTVSKKTPEADKSAASQFLNLFTPKTAHQKKKYVGGHEQSNHDEEHVQRHMDIIDKEHAAAAQAQAALDAEKAAVLASVASQQAALGQLKKTETLEDLNKVSSGLDETAQAIKNAQEALSTSSSKERSANALQGGGVVPNDSSNVGPGTVVDPDTQQKNSDSNSNSNMKKRPVPVRPPSKARFVRGVTPDTIKKPDAFATVADSDKDKNKDQDLDLSANAAAERKDEQNMAEAANSIADFVAPGHQDKVDALRDAAANGDYEALTKLLDDQHVHLIHSKDENEWQLLHEAVRSGNLESVKLLVDLGADIGAKVLSGGAALWIAKYYLEENHPVTQYLIDIGAPDEEL